MQKEHAAGRTRPPCAGHPPRARAYRTTDCARRTDASGSGKTFINSAVAYTAKYCRIASLRGPGGWLALRIGAINSANRVRAVGPGPAVEKSTASGLLGDVHRRWIGNFTSIEEEITKGPDAVPSA